MVGRIFISYRRDDTAGDARSVYQRLQRTFGSRQLFMDVDSIQRGRDFHQVLDRHLKQSAIMLAVIGPRWVDARDAEGNRRLEDPDDFIRLEVARALKRDIAVIPLLVGGARMPKAGELPADLRGLTRRQGITITHENFPSDMDALEKDIGALLQRPKLRSLIAVSSTVLALIVLVSAYVLGAFAPSPSQPRSERQASRKAEDAAARAAADKLKSDATAKRQANRAEQRRRELEAKKSAPAIWTPPLDRVLTAAEEQQLAPKQEFQECRDCPRMILVPAGSYLMGSAPTEPGHSKIEAPQHSVTIAKAFASGKFEVTFDQYKAFMQETNHTAPKTCSNFDPNKNIPINLSASFWSPGFQQEGDHPAVCVSWRDAKAYVAWLSKTLAKEYRLLSEAEWEYVARAGSHTRYHFGDSEMRLCEFGNVADSTDASKLSARPLAECRDGYVRTAPVGKFAANAFGLHDTIGNVWEWVEDCGHANYEGAPSDGSAWLAGACTTRVSRGGGWGSIAPHLRSAARNTLFGADDRYHFLGFRVARTLTRSGTIAK